MSNRTRFEVEQFLLADNFDRVNTPKNNKYFIEISVDKKITLVFTGKLS